jgi:lipid A ethanolaminephosphotransferase
MVMWFSPEFARNAQLNLDCLRYRADNREYSHDNVYHSMLGLFDVRSSVYEGDLDVFAACRGV